jgi:hypothetical protein
VKTTNDHLPPPLWSTLEKSFLSGRSPGFNDRYGYAAEIRAFSSYIQGFIGSGGDIFQLLNVLEDEANRAETRDD